ncbi:MAG: MATE family efflux transporter [Omnitrophica WOR_2 bacterium SM23_72]|nr:MAG: MATE family efflux transporter [Omnitrophica WOR_2 bacterium SM23_72]
MLRQKWQDTDIPSLMRTSWEVCWPMTFIMFFIFLIGFSDVFVAGRIGKEVQASYVVVAQMYFIFSIIGFALTVGSVSVISRIFTSSKNDALHTAVDSSLMSAAVAGLLLSLVAMIFSRFLIQSLNIPAVLKGYAVSLMQIYSFALFFNYVLLNSNGILRACRMIRKSLVTMAVVCLLNIVLNFTLAFLTPLRFKGIAVATATSALTGCVLNLFFLKRMMTGQFQFSFPITRKIISIGWPMGVLQVFWQMAALVLFLILGALPEHNVEIMAAFTNGLRIEAAIFLPAFAFNMAAAVVIGNFLGQENKKDAFSGGIVTALLGVAIVSVLTLIIIFNARLIAGVLSKNQIVIEACVRYILITVLFEPVMAWAVILAGGLNGAGDTKSVMRITALCVWLVRVPLSYLLALHFSLGAQAVWWSMNASILVQAIFITRRYFSKKWLDHAHIELTV